MNFFTHNDFQERFPIRTKTHQDKNPINSTIASIIQLCRIITDTKLNVMGYMFITGKNDYWEGNRKKILDDSIYFFTDNDLQTHCF